MMLYALGALRLFDHLYDIDTVSMANQNSTKVVTGIVRLSYANVWEPTSVNGGTPKYGVSLIIPKSDKSTVDASDITTVWILRTGFDTKTIIGRYKNGIDIKHIPVKGQT